TDYFKISPNETRVSVITYATWPTLHFRFSRIFKTRQDLYLAIDNIPYSGGGTNTARALTKAYIDMFDTRNGARISGIKRILIVFTDGKSSGNVYYPSQQLKNMGVVIFSIGVGSGIDVLELKTMASSPAKDHVFLLHNFNHFAHLAHNMSFNACNGNTTNITHVSTTPHPNRGSCGDIYLFTPGILISLFILTITRATRIVLGLFLLEGGSSCPYDYLDVYDGNSMYAKKLGRFCGQQLPRKLVSSGSKLLIVFHTDSSVQKQGFVLYYTDTNDTNKCSGAPCAPYANCTKINGLYVCVCKPGYNGNGTSCTDIDECNGPNNCSPNAVCHNVVGSYTCDCSHGYHGDGTRCDDIDECRDQPQKCTGAGESCTNYPGRYRCGCISSGQQFIDNKCTDIQASVQGEFRIINRQYIPAFNIINSAEYFEFTEMLINELTSLYRRTPKIHSTFRLIIILRLFPGSVGFEYVATFSDKKGIDLGNIQDELAHSLQVTHDGTFLGNGLKISDSTNITEVGKRLRVQDIDECSEDSNSCPANSECKNTIGSFTCSCNSGYVGNGTICQVSEISKEPTEHGTKWYIFVIIIVAGIVIGLLIAYVVACLRRRYLKRKVLCNADVQHSYQNSVYELDVAKLEDNFYESGGTASRESSPPYEELSNVRDPENTYGSLK
ncbi:matrilin-2-like, partial [Dendronephthya gigantea]|uniref:matrilin-2-like n=1 Tax=Dendronephthya gigantea TaxID=151771 RepID=UPI00106AE0B6